LPPFFFHQGKRTPRFLSRLTGFVFSPTKAPFFTSIAESVFIANFKDIPSYMKRILLLPFLFFATYAIAQRGFTVDNTSVSGGNSQGNFYTVSGVPYQAMKYSKIVSGSAYFGENWMKANILFDNNNLFNNVVVRIDLIDNSVEYIDPVSGQRMIATSSIKEINMVDTVTGSVYHFVHSSFVPGNKDALKCWYQLLANGTASAYKRTTKTLSESYQSYGSATSEQQIITGEQYYVSTGTEFLRVKKLTAIPDLFPAKKEDLKKYIKEKGLTGKSDTDYISLIDHYNSL
jgi:hypothetical protein